MDSVLIAITVTVIYLLAWLLPVIKEDYEGVFDSPKVHTITFRGWEAFHYSLSCERPSSSSEWCWGLLVTASGLSNFVLVGALLCAVFNAGHVHPVLLTALFVCAVLNTHFFLYRKFQEECGKLQIGYYLWVGSFFFSAALVASGGVQSWTWPSGARVLELSLIALSVTAALAGLSAFWMYLLGLRKLEKILDLPFECLIKDSLPILIQDVLVVAGSLFLLLTYLRLGTEYPQTLMVQAATPASLRPVSGSVCAKTASPSSIAKPDPARVESAGTASTHPAPVPSSTPRDDYQERSPASRSVPLPPTANQDSTQPAGREDSAAAQLLHQAARLFEDREYQAALQQCNASLALEPLNPATQDLKRRIEKTMEILKLH